MVSNAWICNSCGKKDSAMCNGDCINCYNKKKLTYCDGCKKQTKTIMIGMRKTICEKCSHNKILKE